MKIEIWRSKVLKFGATNKFKPSENGALKTITGRMVTFSTSKYYIYIHTRGIYTYISYD